MDVFKGQNLLEYSECFQNDENCKECLSHLKWDIGYRCRKCCHEKSQIRNDFSRTCNICSDTESPTAKTLFHGLKFGVRKAFFICFVHLNEFVLEGRENGKAGRNYHSKKKKTVTTI